jgi:hypothetical protein
MVIDLLVLESDTLNSQVAKNQNIKSSSLTYIIEFVNSDTNGQTEASGITYWDFGKFILLVCLIA